MVDDVLNMDIAQQCDAYMAALKEPEARLYAEVITRGLHVSKAGAALLHAHKDKTLGTEESDLQVYTDLLTEFGRHFDGLRTVTQGLDAKQGSALGTEGGPPGTEAHIAAIVDTKQEHWLSEDWATEVLRFADEARISFVKNLQKVAILLVDALQENVSARAMLRHKKLLVNPVLQPALWTGVESSTLGKLGSAASRVSKFFKSAVMEGLVTDRSVVVDLDRLCLAAKRAVGVRFATKGLIEGVPPDPAAVPDYAKKLCKRLEAKSFSRDKSGVQLPEYI